MADQTGRFALRRPLKIVFNPGRDDERVEEVTEITMRPVETAADLFVTDDHEGEMRKMCALIAKLSGHTFAQIASLDPRDFGELVEKAQSFTQPGQPIGETSSGT